MSSPVMPSNWDPEKPWENVPQVRPPAPPPESFLDMLRRWVGLGQQGTPMTAQQPAPMPSPTPTPGPYTFTPPDPAAEALRRARAYETTPAVRALGEGASNATIPVTSGMQQQALRR